VAGLLFATAQVHSSNLCLDEATLMFVALGIEGHCGRIYCDGYLLCCITASCCISQMSPAVMLLKC